MNLFRSERFTEFLERIKSLRGPHRPEQWKNIPRLMQYRVPYSKTITNLKQPLKILDWGCGNGHWATFLLANGHNVVGYSYENEPVFLREDNNFVFVRGVKDDGVGLPFSDSEFDVVFSMGVIEHVHEKGGEPIGSIREIFRVLKPGGYFYCFHLPDKGSWVEFLVRKINRIFGLKLHEHVALYDRTRFYSLLKNVQGDVIDSGRYNFFPRNIMKIIPKVIADRPTINHLINGTDNLLGLILRPFTTNWFFIVRKKQS